MLPLVCCDLDGVVWRGDTTIPGAPQAVARLRSLGARVVFVTNNSNATRAQYLAKLERHGVASAPEDLVTSAMAAAALLGERLDPGAAVLACAGAGVHEACAEHGLEVVDDGPSDALVVGWHREFDFERLRIAADAARSGSWFVATNDDPTYPAADGGILPGNGSLVAAVATASGIRPEVAGKPHRPMVRLVHALADAHAASASGVMIGDRWSTDGRFAAALGWPFALVRSGIDDAAPDAGAGPSAGAPGSDASAAFDAPDLAALVEHLVESRLFDQVT